MSKKTLRTAQDLATANLINHDAVASIAAVADKYAIAIPPSVTKLLHIPEIRQQFVPSVDEVVASKQDLADPVGDKVKSPIKGIIRRYPDRCLLQPVTVCPMYCRFCFRRETVGKGDPALTAAELDACYAYIQQHPELWEVILSGGDPLILKPKQLASIISNLDQIKHVEIIRIHTRVPMLDPDRVNAAMLAALTQRQPMYIVLHINHPAEFTTQAIAVINQLVNSGIVLLGQSVLLKGINDNVETLGQLMRSMVKNRIKPYYLHHLDLAVGTSHFRTTIAQGQELVAGLRGKYSGLCQPEYVLDIPGGAGKSPIGPGYIFPQEQGYKVVSYAAEEYFYLD